MNFEQTISNYLEHLGHRGYSPRTIEAHGEHLRTFARFIARFYPRVTTFESVTRDIAEDYQRYIADLRNDRGQVISNATKNKKLGPVRKLFSWLVDQDQMISNPAKTLLYMKEDQRLIRNVLTEEEMKTVLSSLQTRTPVGLRNRAIFELLYACGIRTSELCNLKVEDVDLKDQTVLVVNGKGGKSRLMPIGQYATHYIEQYLGQARKYMLRTIRQDPGNLFLSSRGRPFNRSTLNSTVMKTIRKSANIAKHFSSYSIRHTTATQLLKNDVDIAFIAQLLGHSSLRTTQRYLKIEIGDLKRMHSLYHPRERDHESNEMEGGRKTEKTRRLSLKRRGKSAIPADRKPYKETFYGYIFRSASLRCTPGHLPCPSAGGSIRRFPKRRRSPRHRIRAG